MQSQSLTVNDISMSSHPYNSLFYGLSDREAKDVELVENLLLSAEKFRKPNSKISSLFLESVRRKDRKRNPKNHDLWLGKETFIRKGRQNDDPESDYNLDLPFISEKREGKW
ncbi:hypothetical protein L6452_40231 [Arctium lappa]|uniref:Uncharacterized protein n=1 Tax=Arctium lappa TaxID=4217 RepID=A0ACB8XLX1_ARCLA|nr:hypothetical protein L6452_40231 [Arctium lappa]